MIRDILTSIHGRLVGLNRNGSLLVRGPSLITAYETAPLPLPLGIGAPATAPTAGTVRAAARRANSQFEIDFQLVGARVPVTDAAASGSFGALKLWDFEQAAIVYEACRTDWTAFAEGAALTGAAGDASFRLGLGTTGIAAAADGVLTGAATLADIGSAVLVTLASGTGAGTAVNATSAAVNGTAAAGAIWLNWSGTAATIDASSHIDVTGTISVRGVFVGDD